MHQETETQIKFMWPTDQIFDDINIQTMYAARNKQPLDPQSIGADGTDDFAISEEEREFVMLNIERAIHELFTIFIKQSHSISDSVFINQSVTMNEKQYVGCGFSIKRHTDNKGNSVCNPNRIVSLDTECLQYISYSIMCNWWETVKCIDDITISRNKLTESAKRIKKHLFEISKPFYKKDYSIITT